MIITIPLLLPILPISTVTNLWIRLLFFPYKIVHSKEQILLYKKLLSTCCQLSIIGPEICHKESTINTRYSYYHECFYRNAFEKSGRIQRFPQIFEHIHFFLYTFFCSTRNYWPVVSSRIKSLQCALKKVVFTRDSIAIFTYANILKWVFFNFIVNLIELKDHLKIVLKFNQALSQWCQLHTQNTRMCYAPSNSKISVLQTLALLLCTFCMFCSKRFGVSLKLAWQFK